MGAILIDLLLLCLAYMLLPKKKVRKPVSDGDFILFGELGRGQKTPADSTPEKPYDSEGKNQF